MVVAIGVVLLRLQDVDIFNELLARKVNEKQIMNSPPSII